MDPVPKNQTILVGCESTETRDILDNLLTEYKVSFVFDGTQLVEKARRNPPDLVLLETPLIGMDGFKVCQILKENEGTKDIPVIFMTAHDASVAQNQGLELGAVDIITRPFLPALFRRRVLTHLNLGHATEISRNQAMVLARETDELQKTLRELKGASLETIRRLSRAAEYKDDDSGAHIIRMSHYSAAIAMQMGRCEDETSLILHASPLHDLGKIGIPDQVLLKPGKLNARDWVAIKSHCEIGATILAGSNLDVIKCGETIARSHHESWDGMGYPHGLKGEAIPLVARIAAAADVFDALTTERPYREPLSLEKSFEIMQQERERHLDPAVVDAFFQIVDEILVIKRMFADEDTLALSFTTD